MGKLMLNGVCYTGGSSSAIDGGGGAYIDTNTVIQAQTVIPANTDVTYTATQDCVVVYYINIVANSMGLVSVDGVNVDGGWATALTGLYGCVFLATGQTITLRQTYTTENGVYTVYGVLGGSGGSSSGHNYSTTEQVVGTWIDGKTLYEKTIFGTTEQSVPETQVNHGINNLDTVVSIEGSIRCGTQYQTLFEHSRPSNEEFTRISDTVISIVSTDGDWRGKPFHITLRYTKTTDTALKTFTNQ